MKKMSLCGKCADKEKASLLSFSVLRTASSPVSEDGMSQETRTTFDKEIPFSEKQKVRELILREVESFFADPQSHELRIGAYHYER